MTVPRECGEGKNKKNKKKKGEEMNSDNNLCVRQT